MPDPYRDAVAALAGQKQSALLRIGPKRNRWRNSEALDARLLEIERRRQKLIEEIGAVRSELADEPARHTAGLAEWLAAESKGERPAVCSSPLPAAQGVPRRRSATFRHTAAFCSHRNARR